MKFGCKRQQARGGTRPDASRSRHKYHKKAYHKPANVQALLRRGAWRAVESGVA
jgi:hypothetical protein